MKRYACLVCFLLLLTSFRVSAQGGECDSGCKKKDTKVYEYDFLTKSLLTPKLNINQNKYHSIRIVNFNSSKYTVTSITLEQFNYSVKSQLPTAFLGTQPDSAEKGKEDPKENKDGLKLFSNDIVKSENVNDLNNKYIEYVQKTKELEKELAWSEQLKGWDRQPTENELSSIKKVVDNSDQLRSAKTTLLKDEIAFRNENSKTLNTAAKNNLDSMQKYTSEFPLDTMLYKLRSNYYFLKNSENYTIYIPQFRTVGEEFKLTLEYKNATEKSSQLILPEMRLKNYLRVGFGSGPVMVLSPRMNSFFSRSISQSASDSTDVDSTVITANRAKNTTDFAIAAFVDLNYQCTYVTSIGVGIGAGLKVTDNLNGELYSGINLGFRVAKNFQVSFRAGAAFRQKDVLIDRLGTIKAGESKTVDSSIIPENENSQKVIFQKKWYTGLYFGVTFNYMTRSISTK